MKVCYAYRRSVFYPYQGSEFPVEQPELRTAYLRKVREIGFDGIELPSTLGDSRSEQEVRDFGRQLADEGVPCVAVRGGGGLHHPRVATANRQRLEAGVRFAAAVGPALLNTTVGTPARDPTGVGTGVGERVSQGSSRTATLADYERTAAGLREVADLAADLGVEISIEVHQHSIADNSWSALHLLDLIDRPNVGANPDLGNIYWCYEVPEETTEAAIMALAPRAKYWHCKNLLRVHIPENQHSIFLPMPLPDGDIDYRFALTAMHEAGYKGYVAIEGMRRGDQFHGDARSVAYVRHILAELDAGS